MDAEETAPGLAQAGETLKRDTVFKGIRLIEDDEDSIECGQGRNTVVLKTCFLKKA